MKQKQKKKIDAENCVKNDVKDDVKNDVKNVVKIDVQIDVKNGQNTFSSLTSKP
jgi:hypothetical protein